MSGYVPGEQPGSDEHVVKLNTNENPFHPSDRVLQAITSISKETLRRYPNPTADAFRIAARPRSRHNAGHDSRRQRQ